MKRTKEEAEETRRQLLEAAAKMFSAKGFGATRLSDIAKEAGMTRGAIYWHFKNKQEMLLTLSKEQIDPIFEVVFQVFSESLKPLEKIKKIIHIMLTKIMNDNSFLCSMNLNFIELKLRNEIPEIKSYMDRKRDDVARMLQKLIETGISEGEIRAVDSHAITEMLFSIISGYIMMTHDGELTIDLKPDTVIDVLLNGLKI